VSKSKLIDCEIWIAMNEDGDWVVVREESEARERLDEDAGGYYIRIVKVTVRMSPPVMTEAIVTIADDVGELAALA
jgi:hypothetical protein